MDRHCGNKKGSALYSINRQFKEVQTRHRRQLTSSGLLTVCLYKRLAMLSSMHRGSPLSLYNFIEQKSSTRLHIVKPKNHQKMKKILEVIVILILGTILGIS